MKKLLALLLAMLLVFSLAACGTDNESSGRDKPSETGTEDPGETAKPATDDNADETPEEDETQPPEEDETPEESDPFGPETLALIASVNEDTAKASGTCGEDLTWYYLDNMLVIRGTGDMEDYNLDPRPWSRAAGQIELVYLEDGVTSIGQNAFRELKEMRAFYMPDSVTSIHELAFCFCYKLTYVRLSENLAEIGEGAFISTGFSSFTFPQGITKLERSVFSSADLTSLEIPDSITEIGDWAFDSCNLTSVTIPDSVTSIGRDAFVNCPLTTVTFLGDAPEMPDYEGRLMGLQDGVTIQYSGSGFEPYIETYFQYNWVKQ